MKVGTDGVLLGAWTNPGEAKSILDIGTGTGLIALMLAQKSNAEIHAVELEAEAAEEAKVNFLSSPWSEQISLWNASIQVFSQVVEYSYDLIISNPPFFNSKSKTISRTLARSQHSLNHADLIDSVDLLLNPTGSFCLVLPFEDQDSFLELAQSKNLYPNRICAIYGNAKSPCKRVLLELSRNQSSIETSSICLEKEKRHDYTDDYLNLVKDYLLIKK